MKLKLKRIYRGNTYTIGRLYIDNEYFCDTLEDKDRELTSYMSEEDIKSLKVYSETAIPTGTYKIEVTFSSRFKKKMPVLIGVKGFSGIRIHCGNDETHTSGCILCGFNKEKGKVVNSKVVTSKVYALIENAINNNNEVEITIE
ncbi:DUF5675 family protein [Bacteroides stercoris]|jgi:hypothetical protein|uniref:DUF5675 family protein n=1 Tax=Bacteroides stercoris TaxID=46506 RepID=UPI0015B06231|nr:MAG TPA: hypothetical protein [Caudoviricetes sp.]